MAAFNTTFSVLPTKASLNLTSSKISRAVNIGFASASSKNFDNALGRITGKASEFNKSLDAATARVFAFGATAAVLDSIRQSFQSLVRVTIEVESKLKEIQAVLGTGQNEFEAFANAVFDVGRKTGQSFQVVSEGAVELARQGLSAAKSAFVLESALVLTNISGVDAEKSVKTLTATMNGFASSSLDAATIVNKLVAVDTAFAVSADDLADGLSRVGSTAEDAGLSLEETVALITALQQRTARGGAVIGNALKTIFPRVTRGDTITQLQELGIAIDSSQTGIQKLQAIADGLNQISDPIIANKIKELAGGIRQINIVSSIFKDLGSDASIYRQAIETAAEAGNEAFEKNAQIVDTLKGNINSLVVTFTELGAKIGDITLKPILGRAVSIAESIGSFLDGALAKDQGINWARTLLDAISNFIQGPGVTIATVAFLKIFGLVIRFAKEGVKEIFKIGAANERIKQTEAGIIDLLNKDNRLVQQLASNTLTREQKEIAVLKAIQSQNRSLLIQKDLLSKITGFVAQSGITYKDGLFGKTRRGKASGHQASAALEVLTARSLGATKSVKAQLSKGTIDGRKFMMNSQETEITNFGRNGDSAVIPHYSRGHIPNFAIDEFRKYKEFISRFGGQAALSAEQAQELKTLQEGASKQIQKAGRITGFKSAISGPGGFGQLLTGITNPQIRGSLQGLEGGFGVAKAGQITKEKTKRSRLINVNSVLGEGAMPSILTPFSSGSITTKRKSEKGNVPSTLRQFGEKTFQFTFDAFKANFANAKTQGLFDKTLNADKVYDSIVAERVLPLAQSIFGAPAASGGIKKSDELKRGVKVLLGSVFESALQSGLNITARNPTTEADFDVRFSKKEQGEALRTIFGANSLPASKLADFKYSTDGKAAAEMAGKVFRERSFFGKLYAAVSQSEDSGAASAAFTKFRGGANRKKNAAFGYIPNFANPLGEAIGRERAAGLPVSQIRVGSHRNLIGAGNPLGLGVTNTRDEPRGLRDVFARGNIPNFVKRPKLPFIPKSDPLYTEMYKFVKEFAKGKRSLKELNDAAFKLEKTFGRFGPKVAGDFKDYALEVKSRAKTSRPFTGKTFSNPDVRNNLPARFAIGALAQTGITAGIAKLEKEFNQGAKDVEIYELKLTELNAELEKVTEGTEEHKKLTEEIANTSESIKKATESSEKLTSKFALLNQASFSLITFFPEIISGFKFLGSSIANLKLASVKGVGAIAAIGIGIATLIATLENNSLDRIEARLAKTTPEFQRQRLNQIVTNATGNKSKGLSATSKVGLALSRNDVVKGSIQDRLGQSTLDLVKKYNEAIKKLEEGGNVDPAVFQSLTEQLEKSLAILNESFTEEGAERNKLLEKLKQGTLIVDRELKYLSSILASAASSLDSVITSINARALPQNQIRTQGVTNALSIQSFRLQREQGQASIRDVLSSAEFKGFLQTNVKDNPAFRQNQNLTALEDTKKFADQIIRATAVSGRNGIEGLLRNTLGVFETNFKDEDGKAWQEFLDKLFVGSQNALNAGIGGQDFIAGQIRDLSAKSVDLQKASLEAFRNLPSSLADAINGTSGPASLESIEALRSLRDLLDGIGQDGKRVKPDNKKIGEILSSGSVQNALQNQPEIASRILGKSAQELQGLISNFAGRNTTLGLEKLLEDARAAWGLEDTTKLGIAIKNFQSILDPSSKAFEIAQSELNKLVISYVQNGRKVGTLSDAFEKTAASVLTQTLPQEGGKSRIASFGFSEELDPDKELREVKTELQNLKTRLVSFNLAFPELGTRNELIDALSSVTTESTNLSTKMKRLADAVEAAIGDEISGAVSVRGAFDFLGQLRRDVENIKQRLGN